MAALDCINNHMHQSAEHMYVFRYETLDIMPRLHLPRSSYDLFLYDFSTIFLAS